MNTKIIVIIIIAVIGVGIYGYKNYMPNSEKEHILIYAAASVASQMNETAAEFKKKHSNVEVQVKSGGSNDLISQITKLNKSADIMVSADYGLIDQSMVPNFTSFNIEFARNEMVLAYNDKSKNSTQINDTNWYQILNQSDVKIGLADPNSAPAGYRGVMMMKLVESYYNDSNIFHDLIESNSALTSEYNGTGYTINSPGNLNPSSKIVSKPAVGDLMPLLKTSSVDYAFVYKSDAEAKTGDGVKYMTFPPELALSSTEFESIYNHYKIVQFSDTNKSKSVVLSPIVYGITVLNNALNRDLAIEFLKLLLSPEGNKITKDNYQYPIVPSIVTNDSSNIPESLKSYLKNT